jgi:hypothetical protein
MQRKTIAEEQMSRHFVSEFACSSGNSRHFGTAQGSGPTAAIEKSVPRQEVAGASF